MEHPKRAHPRGRVKPNLALLGKKGFVSPSDKSKEKETAVNEASSWQENCQENEQNISLPISCNTDHTENADPKSDHNPANGRENNSQHSSSELNESDLQSTSNTQVGAEALPREEHIQQQVSSGSVSQAHADSIEIAASSDVSAETNESAVAENVTTVQAKRAHPRGRVAPKIGGKVSTLASISKAGGSPHLPTTAEISDVQRNEADEDSTCAPDHGESGKSHQSLPAAAAAETEQSSLTSPAAAAAAQESETSKVRAHPRGKAVPKLSKSAHKESQNIQSSSDRNVSEGQELPPAIGGETENAEGSEREAATTATEEETISSTREDEAVEPAQQAESSSRERETVRAAAPPVSPSAVRNSATASEEQAYQLDALASAASAQLKEMSSSALQPQESAEKRSALPADTQPDENQTGGTEDPTRTKRAPKRNRNSKALADTVSTQASSHVDENEARNDISLSSNEQASQAEKGRKKKSKAQEKKKSAADSQVGDGNDSTIGNEGAGFSDKRGESGKKRKAASKTKNASAISNEASADLYPTAQSQATVADVAAGANKNLNGSRKQERPRNQRVPSAPEKSVEQRTIRELMRDPTYGMPMSAEGQARAEKRRKRTGETNQTTTFEIDAQDSQVDNSSVMAPQVRTVGGRIVIDDSSLTVSNATESNMDMSDIVLDQSGRGTNIWSKKRKHCDRWTAEETERFYIGLRKFGLDFQLIASWMGDRRNDRRHVRNKFKKEERLNLERINQAIANRMPVNDDDWRKVKGLGAPQIGQDSREPVQTEAAGLPEPPAAMMENESGSDLPEDDANDSDDY